MACRGKAAVAIIDTRRGGEVQVKTGGSEGTRHAQYRPGARDISFVNSDNVSKAKAKVAFLGNTAVSVKGMNP